MEEHHLMMHYLRYCCAMFFALISFLLAPPLSAQAQTREAYVAQSADTTTLTFYYDDQRATHTGTTWGIEETKKEGDYTFPAWAGTWEVADSTTTRVVFDVSFRNFRPTITARWFCNYGELTQIEGFQYLNTSEVKDMSGMFYGCSGLTSLDLSRFNTQNVTDMRAMFYGCSGLTSLDLKNFNTQNVTDMRAMFRYCSGLISLDVSHFDTQNVTDMRAMFYGCSGLTSLDVSNFNTQNVTDMQAMFHGCYGLTSLDVKNFNTQNVTNMVEMFSSCYGLTSLDVKNFNTQNVTDMGYMFSGCLGLTSLDVSHFNTQNVTDMGYMFSGCYGLTSLDLSHFNTQNVTDMGYMFSGCRRVTSLDLLHFNTKNVTNMHRMFSDCSGLTSLGLSHFNTQNVTDMSGMFWDCSGLTSLDLSHFNTQNVTDMIEMFRGCSGLTSLDVSNFNTQNVTNMAAMFHYCSGLTSLDVSHFNTQKVTDMSFMFSDCSALATIRSNTAWQCPESKYMFARCTQLKGAVPYNENKTDATMANPETGYFTRSNGGGVEAYVVQSADKTTLTFYYDDQRATRTGTTWGIEETKEGGKVTFPVWAGTYLVADGTITRVVFDASFRDFRPTTTARWFNNYRALKQIEGLEYLNTQNVTDMRAMFNRCSGLTSLDVKNFNTQNVTEMRAMFNRCSALTTISSNTAWQCPQSKDMFTDCTKLKGAVGYDGKKTNATMANPETGYFTAKPTTVESVRFGADDAQHIYTLQGKRVRGAWKHLPAGVYVVNGKKTVKP